MNLEQSIVESITIAAKEIRRETCIEKQATSLMKIYDAIVINENSLNIKDNLKASRKRKRSIDS
jgi:hypothetical protein